MPTRAQNACIIVESQSMKIPHSLTHLKIVVILMRLKQTTQRVNTHGESGKDFSWCEEKVNLRDLMGWQHIFEKQKKKNACLLELYSARAI